MIDTTNTYHAGYAVAAIIYLAYSFSLWRRAKKLATMRDRGQRPE